MSDYTDEIDGDNVICPYCKHEYQPDHEDFSEDERTEECSNCGKFYHIHQSFSVDHHSEPDCKLNGEKHKWVPIILRSGRVHDFCDVCDKCRPYPAKAD